MAAYKFVNGLWLFQLEPKLFLNRFDGFTWLFMKTGLHQWLIDNEAGWAMFDTLFYAMPLVFFLSHNVYKVGTTASAVVMLLVNWVYVQCYTLYPSNSIEAHTAWLLFPVLFIVIRSKNFDLLAEGLRYFFLFIMVSAGTWKLVSGAVFNEQQMSAILLYQHTDLLLTSPGYWQTELIRWLVDNETAGFVLYLSAMALELAFLVGFFTKRYDHLLIIAFLVFLVFDLVVMRIPYFDMLPYLVLLRMTAMRRDLLSFAAPLQSRSQS